VVNGDGEQGQESSPARRLILLGASNVTRNVSTAVNACRSVFPEPLDIVTASGHGRGYGITSWVLGRTLVPILQCGIWDALANRRPLETTTVLTDIGNDLVFGASSEQVANWIEQCLQRLRPLSSQIVVTEMPLASVVKLGAVRFRLLRALLFPRSLLTHGIALQQVGELNERVVKLAHKYDARLIRPAEHWYGIDPIHIKRRHKADAWQSILSMAAQPGTAVSTARNAIATSLQPWSLCCLRPHHRRLFGVEQTREQPCVTLSDGTLISLY
jgi:hypothetical protein